MLTKNYASSAPVLVTGLNGTKSVHKEEHEVSIWSPIGIHLIVNQKYVLPLPGKETINTLF